MRRRRSRSRLASCLAGTALLGGTAWIAPPIATTLIHDMLAKIDTAGSEANRKAVPPDPLEAAPSAPPEAVGGLSGPDTLLVQPGRTVEARPGDTPLKMLARMGVAPDDAQAAVRTLSTVWNPRDLRPGQKAAILVQSDRLLSLRLALAPGRDVVIARDDTGSFVAEDQDRPTYTVTTLGTGTIHSSLSEAAGRAGVPIGVLGEMIRAFSYDVDFQREIHSGDTFTMLYERIDDEFGRATGKGRLLYCELVLSGTRLRLYRFQPSDGEADFYNAIGESIRKALLRTPVDAARITSGFGMRFHPILGYSRMHRGVDFAAPTGTAVYAAGDGVVSFAGRSSGYGNYIELTHNQQYATAYGHLSGFARGLHEGTRVRQGEVIGYVGMTGMATGPHLHYEVHLNGEQIDPLSVKMPATTRLAEADLKAFYAARARIDGELGELRQELVAHAGPRSTEPHQAASAP
jgi:murein DD-endopeptidase MepM/ murein hydrolase activator NlpD